MPSTTQVRSQYTTRAMLGTYSSHAQTILKINFCLCYYMILVNRRSEYLHTQKQTRSLRWPCEHSLAVFHNGLHHVCNSTHAWFSFASGHAGFLEMIKKILQQTMLRNEAFQVEHSVCLIILYHINWQAFQLLKINRNAPSYPCLRRHNSITTHKAAWSKHTNLKAEQAQW
jgi:hypothetical protein